MWHLFLRPGLQRTTGFQEGLEAREDARPALRNLPLHIGTRLELVVRDREADHVGDGLDVEGDARMPLPVSATLRRFRSRIALRRERSNFAIQRS
jgi:hypothetical protein